MTTHVTVLLAILFCCFCSSSSHSVTLSITADNDLLELYVDGERYNVDKGEWMVTRTVQIPAHAQVIAVRCADRGVVAGLLAATSDGRLVTDRSWKCTTQPNNHHWMTLSYSDAFWPTAVIAAPHSASDIHGIRPFISTRASWIWTARNGYGGTAIDSQVYCRVRLTSPNFQNRPRSCREIKNARGSSAPSGEYSIWIPRLGDYIKVYCEMGLNGGGYTFLNPFNLPTLNDADIQALFTDRTSFLLRARLTDGSQSFGVLQQLHQYHNSQLKVYLNNYFGYTRPQNAGYIGSPFLFFGFIPASHAAILRTTQGLQVNGNSVTFSNCDANPNSYIALFPNFLESSPTSYHYSMTHVMSTRFLQLLKPVNSRRVMPEEYFMFMEMHFGGCGTYTQTDGRPDFNGVLSASIGFR